MAIIQISATRDIGRILAKSGAIGLSAAGTVGLGLPMALSVSATDKQAAVADGFAATATVNVSFLILVGDLSNKIICIRRDKREIFVGAYYRVDVYSQQPAERIDYLIDLSSWVPENDNVISTTATSVPYTPDAPPETVDLDVAVSGGASTKPKVWCYGGEDGVAYKVTVLVTTASSRVKEVDFIVKVISQ
jgi:hypothetical protein